MKLVSRSFVSLILLSLVLLAAAVACSDPASRSTNGTTNPAASPVKPQTITLTDLAKLKWIEGSWRGSGDVEKPFFERYRFENDSTLLVESFDDESISKVTDVTRFELKDEQFGNVGESRWVTTKLDDKSITFSPVAKARNTFIWQFESKDVWKAILNWPATDNSSAKQRVYTMERIK